MRLTPVFAIAACLGVAPALGSAAVLTFEVQGRADLTPANYVFPGPVTNPYSNTPDPGGALIEAFLPNSLPVPATYDFGFLFAGLHTYISLQISNVGTQAATNLNWLAVDGASFGFAGALPSVPGFDASFNTCGSSLNAGASCVLALAFAPIAPMPRVDIPDSTFDLYNDFAVIQYDSATAVPLPATASLMLAGMGALAFGARGRRRPGSEESTTHPGA